ncbi:MAG: TonB-dependent receptor [Saprospiraceae bacterium]|nr:TonB-dependent receptor [Saprospiraceae bacterium]
MYKQLFLVLLILYLLPKTQAQEKNTQKFTLNGYVEDEKTGEKLIGASVYDARTGKGTSTNVYGFYSLTLSQDSIDLVVASIGLESQSLALYLDKDQSLNFKLSEMSNSIGEVTVKASDVEESIEERTQMSQVSIPVEQIKKLPSIGGEVDILKALQLTPGVQSGTEGMSGLYVRGGSPDQNLILLDGVPVYNASHLFGFLSVFNADAIRNVTLTKGGYPARFGGRLSSVLEIDMKEGNLYEFHGEGSIGLLSSKIMLEGPIIKEKTSFLLAGRFTYGSLIYDLITPKRPQGYYFYDINAKINHRFNDKHRLYLSVYAGDDKMYDSENISFDYEDGIADSKYKFNLGWGNITGALRWNYLISDKLFANTTLTYTRYDFALKASDYYAFTNIDTSYSISYNQHYFSNIEDWAGKIDFDYIPNPSHYIKFGFSGTSHRFLPGASQEKDEETGVDTTRNGDPIYTGEYAVYIEDDIRVGNNFSANIGVHASAFAVDRKFYYSVQPRVGLRYMFPKRWAVKGSFAMMTQYLHLLANEGIGLPTDLWVPSTQNIGPERSWQAAIGVAKTFEDLFEISVEGYYRKMYGVISYKPGASFLEADANWEDKVVSGGTGETYGAELFIRRQKGKFTGWLGYTLSWSWRQFEGTIINSGERYPFKYDRRHDFSIVGMYSAKPWLSMSASWVFSTGSRLTLPTEVYQAASMTFPHRWGNMPMVTSFESKNNYKMRPYHRLDVSIDFHKKHKKFESTWTVGFYNIYARRNPFFISLQYNDQGVMEYVETSIFTILPSFRWSFKF